MTAVSQIVKSLPHGWIQLPDFFNWFRQFPRHSGTPCYGIVFGNIPPFEGTLPSPILALAFMPIAVLIIGTWFESKLRTILNAQFAAPYGSARGRQKRRRCLVDSIQQVLVPEGLGKELHRAGFHGLHRHRNTSVTGDKDDGNAHARH